MSLYKCDLNESEEALKGIEQNIANLVSSVDRLTEVLESVQKVLRK